jgi:ComF family protein
LLKRLEPPPLRRARRRFDAAAQDFGPRILEFLFPPMCVMCRAPVSEAHNLCGQCWAGVSFLDGPSCACCGVPFEIDPGEGSLCGPCHAKAPDFTRARAVMRYDEASKGAILALKHADRLEIVPAFAHWMARAGRPLLEAADLIVPVPLHRRRLWWRRFNQSAELAKTLERLTGTKAGMAVLIRARPTQSQGAMPSAKARRRNVLGAFRVPDEQKPFIAKRHILLVDDVFTTGATVGACARALKRAGAAEVSVLTLARVVREGGNTI